MDSFLKRSARALLRTLGYEVRNLRHPHSLAEFLCKQDVDLVLDVGANIGQFAQLLRVAGYTGTIISFEPLSAIFRELKNNADADKNWSVHQCAVGAGPGAGTLNVSQSSVFSSFKRLTGVAENFGEEANVIANETVEIITVDQFLRNNKARRVFLKLDTQGYDREVLEGAIESLPRIVGLQIELSSMPLYEETWDIPQALKYIQERGYSVCQVWPVNYLNHDSSVSLEFDFVCCANSLLQSPK